MPDPLVETKLLLPRTRVRAVARPRLDDLIRRGSEARLTLVSAPAGFGKTTLLGSWFAAGGGQPTAWVSLDERDQDPRVFWSYVLQAVERAVPGTAAGALTQLQSGHITIDSVLTTLLNELSVLPDDLTVVLDDYHLAESPDIQPGVAFLLDHLPPQVHIIISTRADPALPLARLRARGELVEVRAGDLRFTTAEATAYLNDIGTLGLEPDDIAALESRTEGWAVALQLAALSLQGRADPSQFIAGFAGDDRFVVDYLADEVLDRQPADLRRFLFDSSVLERMNGSLCDAVMGRSDGQAVLESLERQNLFIVPLDDNRRWFRYHHLFADVLHARLLDERPDDVADLHRRASDWYDHAGDAEAAVTHALAAGDTGLAADLVELAIPVMLRERREDVVRRWATQLPDDVASNRPVLAVGLIGGLMSSNDFDGLDQRLGEVERLLNTPAEELVVVDEREFARLPAAVETYRAALTLVHGDLSGTVKHAERALARAAADDYLSVASASALSGIASWADGDLSKAHTSYRAASDNLARAGHVPDVMGCAITLADIEMTQGKLTEAQQTFESALALTEPGATPLRGAADMYVGLSRVVRERGDLVAAADHLRRADELGEALGLPQYPYRWRAAMAHLRAAEGDLVAAIALLDEAQRVYVGDFAPNVRPIPAARARVLVAAGDITGALGWARDRGITANDELTYQLEYEHLTLARVLLADHAGTGREASLADATGLIDRLLAPAEAADRTGSAIEVLTLQALARDAAGSREKALTSLEAALRYAEPEGYVDVFTNQGHRMLGLLRELARRNRDWASMQHVLAACAQRNSMPDAAAATTPGTAFLPRPDKERPRPPQLVDPLSSRELDVLRFLRSDLDGPAIARELGVSLSTVRTHTQHIYVKLGVSNRRAAVRRAHQLNLNLHAVRR